MAGSVPSVRRPSLMPSGLKQLAQSETLKDNETFFLVEAFIPAFREKQNKRFVKKTLSIPYWLNTEAERQGINFSHTLQNAIKQQLNISMRRYIR